MQRPIALALALIAATLAPARAATGPVTEEEAHAIGVEAYLYFYSPITMDLTRKQLTNQAGPGGDRRPDEQFRQCRGVSHRRHARGGRPNFDTLYSSGWLDLTKEPMVVSVPDTDGRYYLLPMLDMWTDVFASPGSAHHRHQSRQFPRHASELDRHRT